jgi:PAS domain S-box-containing protein
VDSRIQLLGETVLEANPDMTALRENEERVCWLAAIIDSNDDAIVGKNLDGVITSWNRGAQRVFGYTAEEAVGQPTTIAIPKDRQVEKIARDMRFDDAIQHYSARICS